MTLDRRAQAANVQGGLYRSHQTELIAQPERDANGAIVEGGEVRWLMRCLSCGNRQWASTEVEAREISVAHRATPNELSKPVRRHYVVAQKDSGATKAQEFQSAETALRWIEYEMRRNPSGGWSYAYLTGFKSPEAMIGAFKFSREIVIDGSSGFIEFDSAEVLPE